MTNPLIITISAVPHDSAPLPHVTPQLITDSTAALYRSFGLHVNSLTIDSIASTATVNRSTPRKLRSKSS